MYFMESNKYGSNKADRLGEDASHYVHFRMMQSAHCVGLCCFTYRCCDSVMDPYPGDT